MATVLVKTGEEFIRISTSMKSAKGERAVGTKLDHSHPAYKSLLAGTPYSGIATIFGREFFTQYHPVKDGSGQVIAALFVGIDFTGAQASPGANTAVYEVAVVVNFVTTTGNNDMLFFESIHVDHVAGNLRLNRPCCSAFNGSELGSVG